MAKSEMKTNKEGTMASKIKMLMVSVAIGVMGAVPAQASTLLGDFFSEVGVTSSVEIGMDVYDKYMWRGFKLDSDKVVQPSLSLGFDVAETFTIEGGFWGSWDIQNNDGAASDEVDGWIGLSFDFGFLGEDYEIVSFSVGHTWYDFPEADLYTKEWYFTLALDTMLSPYVTWFLDYDDEVSGGADGNVVEAGISHSVMLMEDYGVSLDLGAAVGYNDKAFIDGDGGYTLLTAGLTLPLTESLTIAPMVGYSMPWGDLEDVNDGNQDDEFFGGISVALSM
jgi:hypothetical protein